MQKKEGISLIVLIITIMNRYDKWLKASEIGKVSPESKYQMV